MAVQVRLKCWQHLSQFGGGGVGAHQQAPFRALNGAGLNGVSKRAWNQGVNEFEPLARGPGELGQARQTGRLLRRFHEGDCLINFDHACIMREP